VHYPQAAAARGLGCVAFLESLVP